MGVSQSAIRDISVTRRTIQLRNWDLLGSGFESEVFTYDKFQVTTINTRLRVGFFS